MINKLNNLTIECITLINRENEFNKNYIEYTYRIKIYNNNNSYFENYDFKDKDHANDNYIELINYIKNEGSFDTLMEERKVDNDIFKLFVTANIKEDQYKLEIVKEENKTVIKNFKNINEVLNYYRLNGIRIPK